MRAWHHQQQNPAPDPLVYFLYLDLPLEIAPLRNAGITVSERDLRRFHRTAGLIQYRIDAFGSRPQDAACHGAATFCDIGKDMRAGVRNISRRTVTQIIKRLYFGAIGVPIGR